MSRITEADAPSERSSASATLVDAEAEVTVNPADMLVGTFPRRRRLWVPLVLYLVTVFLLITLNFLLPRLMPGDPIDALLVQGNPNYVQDDETRAELEKYYNLDGSLPEQYVHYLGRLARADLGVSVYTHVPVRSELGGKIAWSFLLVGTATIIALVIAIPLGVHSGWKRGRRLDRGLLAFFIGYQNLPPFLTASVVFIILAVKLGIFPQSGSVSEFSPYTGFAYVLDVAYHLALPALLLALGFATLEYLVMRSSMVSELGSDYLLVGRAKGLRERRLKYGYAGRNALLPVITVAGLNIGIGLATMIIFIEGIFGYPGVGGYLMGAIGTRDYPAMQGAFLVLTLTVVTVNLVVDLLYRRIDPRTAT